MGLGTKGLLLHLLVIVQTRYCTSAIVFARVNENVQFPLFVQAAHCSWQLISGHSIFFSIATTNQSLSDSLLKHSAKINQKPLLEQLNKKTRHQTGLFVAEILSVYLDAMSTTNRLNILHTISDILTHTNFT